MSKARIFLIALLVIYLAIGAYFGSIYFFSPGAESLARLGVGAKIRALLELSLLWPVLFFHPVH